GAVFWERSHTGGSACIFSRTRTTTGRRGRRATAPRTFTPRPVREQGPVSSPAQVPTRTLWSVLDHHTRLGQAVADLIGGREVLAGPSGLSLLQRHRDQGVHDLAQPLVATAGP